MWPHPSPFFLLVFSLVLKTTLLNVNDQHFLYSQTLFFIIITGIIIVIIIIITFLSVLVVIGREFSRWIRAAWSAPTNWLFWLSHKVNIKFVCCCFYICLILLCVFKLFFGDHNWGIDTLFYIYHMTSFNYDAKEERDVGLSCICHLSNSQILSSV